MLSNMSDDGLCVCVSLVLFENLFSVTAFTHRYNRMFKLLLIIKALASEALVEWIKKGTGGE